MKVVWTPSAREEVRAIRAYIARESVTYAAGVAKRFADTVNTLKQFPELGTVVPLFREYKYVVRERIVQNYRILYTIEKKRIVILSVVHAARNLDSTVM
jgi:plasmid stabilization system protein ParE